MLDTGFIIAILIILIQLLLITIILKFIFKLKHKVVKENKVEDKTIKSLYKIQRHPFHLNKQKVFERYFPGEADKAEDFPPKLIKSKERFTLFENYKKFLISGKKYAD